MDQLKIYENVGFPASHVPMFPARRDRTGYPRQLIHLSQKKVWPAPPLFKLPRKSITLHGHHTLKMCSSIFGEGFSRYWKVCPNDLCQTFCVNLFCSVLLQAPWKCVDEDDDDDDDDDDDAHNGGYPSAILATPLEQNIESEIEDDVWSDVSKCRFDAWVACHLLLFLSQQSLVLHFQTGLESAKQWAWVGAWGGNCDATGWEAGLA